MAAKNKLQVVISAKDMTKKVFRGLNLALVGLRRSLFNFKTALVSVAGAAGIGLLVKSSLEGIDRISKLSRTLGIAVPDLRKLEHAADLANVNIETLARGVRTLNKGAVDFVREGSGEAADAFAALGITAKDLDGILGDQFSTLELIADRFEGLTNSAERSAVAQQLFGGRASELLLVLEQGGEGLRKLGKEAEDFGLILSTATAQNVEEANDAFTRLKNLFKGVRDTVIGALAPAFRELADQIRNNVLKSIEEAGGVEEFGRNLALTLISIFESAALGIRDFTNETIRQLNRVITFSKEVGEALNLEFTKKLETFAEKDFGLIGVFEKFRQEIESAGNALDGVGTKIINTKSAVDQVTKSFDKTLMSMKDARLNGVNKLEDALVSIADRTSTVKDAFRSMAQSIISDLARMAIQQSITGPLAEAMGFRVDGTRAIGGPVQAGGSYLVGERGPELFVPGRSGSIVPNSELAGGGVTVVQNINVSTGVQQTVRAEVMNLMPQIGNAAKSAVLDARRRGGAFAAAF